MAEGGWDSVVRDVEETGGFAGLPDEGGGLLLGGNGGGGEEGAYVDDWDGGEVVYG